MDTLRRIARLVGIVLFLEAVLAAVGTSVAYLCLHQGWTEDVFIAIMSGLLACAGTLFITACALRLQNVRRALAWLERERSGTNAAIRSALEAAYCTLLASLRQYIRGVASGG